MNCQTIPTCKGGLFGGPAEKVTSALPLPAPFVVSTAVVNESGDPAQLGSS